MNARPARRRGKKRAVRTRLSSTSSARSFVIVAVLRVAVVATFKSFAESLDGRFFRSLNRTFPHSRRRGKLNCNRLGWDWAACPPPSRREKKDHAIRYHHPQPRRMVARSFEKKVWSSHELHCDPCEALLRNRSGVVYAKT